MRMYSLHASSSPIFLGPSSGGARSNSPAVWQTYGQCTSIVSCAHPRSCTDQYWPSVKDHAASVVSDEAFRPWVECWRTIVPHLTRTAQFWSVVGSVVLWVITGRALHHLCETTDVSSCLLGLAWKFDQCILMTCTT